MIPTTGNEKSFVQRAFLHNSGCWNGDGCPFPCGFGGEFKRTTFQDQAVLSFPLPLFPLMFLALSLGAARGDSCILWPNSFPLSNKATFENKAQQEKPDKTKCSFHVGFYKTTAFFFFLVHLWQDTNNFNSSKDPSHSYAEYSSCLLALLSYLEKEKKCVRG